MFRFDDVHAVKAIARASQVEFVPRLHHCIAHYNANDRLMGGVLFTEYNGGSILIHMAGFHPRWVNKAMVYLAFNYPFMQLGVNKLFGNVPEWNVRSRNNALHFGFKVECVIPDVYDRLDGVNGYYIMSMYRKDCRWLNMKLPFIDYAPPERTNNIEMPLAYIPTIGMMQ